MGRQLFSRKDQNYYLSIGKKGCSKCGRVFDVKYFHKQNTKSGYRANCKYCQHIKNCTRYNRSIMSEDNFYHKIECTDINERLYYTAAQRKYKLSYLKYIFVITGR